MSELELPAGDAPEAAPCVYRIDQYRDHQGRNLTENVLASGDELPEGLTRFMGQVFVHVNAPGGPPRTIPVPPFSIEADSVERAFALFEGLANAAGNDFKEHLMQEHQRQRIHLPNAQDQQALLGADGKRL